ncbi:MAG: hypothetical protein L3J07_02470 [Candidatus Magasanikbacteria bacterium]|nr:hypothetical protein [Candidatus Magasanikbacteria bacterium]
MKILPIISPKVLAIRLLKISEQISNTEDKFEKIQKLLNTPINITLEILSFLILITMVLGNKPRFLLKFIEMYVESIIFNKKHELDKFFNNEVCRP